MKKLVIAILFLALLTLPALAENIVSYDAIDIDLYGKKTEEIGTIIQKIEYDPTDYLGKTIRMGGILGTEKDRKTGNMYYFVYELASTSACCGGEYYSFDFVWAGEHSYPQDYTHWGETMVVTGVLSKYTVGETERLVLQDSEVHWVAE